MKTPHLLKASLVLGLIIASCLATGCAPRPPVDQWVCKARDSRTTNWIAFGYQRDVALERAHWMCRKGGHAPCRYWCKRDGQRYFREMVGYRAPHKNDPYYRYEAF